MTKKVKLEKGKTYYIEPIEGENYDSCLFKFGCWDIVDVDDEQCFKVQIPELNDIWWDGNSFKITKKD